MSKMKKFFAASALVVVAVMATPVAANAAGYVPASNVAVSGSAKPGAVEVISFKAGSFAPTELVSVEISGSTSVIVGAVTATTTGTVRASATGSASENITLPTDASGTYSITATGNTSGNIATAAITVVPTDAGATAGSLAFTGSTVSMLVVWSAGGAVALGIAFMIVLGLVRRQRANLS